MKHNMKHSFSILLCLALASLLSVSCVNGKKKAPAPAPAESPAAESAVDPRLAAIDKYLTDGLGKGYTPGEVTLSYSDYIAVDDTNPDDILVWGDFWVENFNVVGDTLLFVSGGNHPGKMHVRKDADGHFTTTAFDAVGDGSAYLPTAKAIFGERFADFQEAYSDAEARKAVRHSAISDYVRKNDLAVNYYKDYGWPAVRIAEPAGN